MKKGFSLIATIFVMVVFLLLGTTLVSLLGGDLFSASRSLTYANAFYAAQGGNHLAANLILKNDYNWVDNNWAPGIPREEMTAGAGYPVSVSGLYLGDADYNYLPRNIDDYQFEVLRINSYITWVQTDEGIVPDKDMHWPYQFLGQQCVLDTSAHVLESSTRITQRVHRYLCPTFNYGISTSQGGIELSANNIVFNNMLGGGEDVGIIAAGSINFIGTPTGNINLWPNDLPSNYPCWYPLSFAFGEYERILGAPHVNPSYDLDPQNGGNGPIFIDGNINIVTGGTIKGLICATGSINIRDGITTPLVVNGGLIAGNDIYIGKNISLTVNSASSQYIPDGYFPALVSMTGRITGEPDNVNITGMVFARLRISLNATDDLRFTGAISANGGVAPKTVNLVTTGNIFMTYDPRVRLTYGFRDDHPGQRVNNKLYYDVWREELVFHEKPKP